MRPLLTAGLAGHSWSPLLAPGQKRRYLICVIVALAGLMAAPARATAATAPPPPAPSSAPGAVYVSATENDVFYTAHDHSVWVKNLDNGFVARVSNGYLLGGPSAIYNGSTVIVFGRGTDQALWWTTRTAGGGYANWESLGGILTAKPAAVFTGGLDPADPSDYSVFVRGTDGALYELDHSDTGWSTSFTRIGGQLLAGTGPAAAWVTTPASPSSITFVLTVGTNRALYLTALGLYEFSDVGGQTTSTPALGAAPLTGGQGPRVVGFARGTNNEAYWDGLVLGGSGWTSLGGRLTSGLAATTDGAGLNFVYALGTDNQVNQRTANLNPYPPAFSPSWRKVTG